MLRVLFLICLSLSLGCSSQLGLGRARTMDRGKHKVNTGFEFDRPPDVPVTPAPSPETLRLLRQAVAPELAEVYPQFAAKVFGFGKSA